MNASVFSWRLRAVVAGLALAGGVAHALPQDGNVVTGTARMTRSAATLTITQTSPTLLLDWKQFDIAAQETVTLQQPSRTALALIRIDDAAPSQVRGRLQANGQVWLVNRQGLVFAAGSQVKAGGFLASTLTTPMAARADVPRRFAGAGEGAVVNAGRIEAAEGGYAALLGRAVSNAGELVAPQGSAAVAAGSAAMLAFHGAGLTDLQLVTAGAQHHRAENSGLLQADGGRVLLAAGADDSAVASEVINTGRLQARTVKQEGRIAVLAGMQAGHARIDGVLDASANAGSRGGRVDTNAAQLQLADSVRVTTAGGAQYGTWVIDPQDYTVAASGGDITGATLSANLATTNVTIESSAGKTAGSGNVNINDAVSWSANTTLTLTASNNVNINANLTATGATAGLVLNPNTANGKDSASGSGAYRLRQGASVTLSGATPTLTIAGTSYVVINAPGTAADATTAPAIPTLQGMAALNNLGTNYALGSDIDASATSSWNGGAGFTPAGNGQGLSNPSHTPFTGNFEGLGHSIRNLVINQPGQPYMGLFGYIGGNISNVGLVGGSVSGGLLVGMLAGCVDGTITNSYATGSVTGDGQVGGLAGCGGTIVNSYATGKVSGSYWVGGLVGAGLNVINSYATGPVSASYKYAGGLVGMGNGTVSGSYATGGVTSPQGAGGLVGYNTGGISASHATGAVSGGSNVGGLAGASSDFITGSYATGAVSGSGDSVGGLVGQSVGSVAPGYSSGSVANSYALGNVSTTGCRVGGLVGRNYGPVSTSYAAGSVKGGSAAQCAIGTLVGLNGMGAAVSSAYWNSSRTGSLPAIGYNGGSTSSVAGLTPAQMRTAASFGGFTFTTTPGASGNNWVIVDVDGSLNNAGNAAGATFPLLAAEYGSTLTNAHQLQLMTMNLSGSYTLAADIDLSVVGNGKDVWNGVFVPFGSFAGVFDGGGHRISNFSLTLGGSGQNLGLFSSTAGGATISNVRLAGSFINAKYGEHVGSLVGWNQGTVTNSCANGIVVGSHQVGGLVGRNNGTISNSCGMGGIKGTVYVGGLAGFNGGSVTSSYATANTTASYEHAGGLVGVNHAAISNSYATGAVQSTSLNAGGLVGVNGGTISNSYAAGPVKGASETGGLVGWRQIGKTSNSFWDTTTSRQSGSVGGIGMNTANMQMPANFTSATPANGNVNPAWDAVNVWLLQAGSYPQLRVVSPAP